MFVPLSGSSSIITASFKRGIKNYYSTLRQRQLATNWTVRGSNPSGGEIFRTCPDRSWGPPSLLYNGYRVFPGAKERPGRDADPSPLLVPWSWKGRAIPLLPLWAVRSVQSLNACTGVHFTFFATTKPRVVWYATGGKFCAKQNIGKTIAVRAMKVPGGSDSQLSGHSANEGAKVVSPTHR